MFWYTKRRLGIGIGKEKNARKRNLGITRTLENKPKVKFCISNVEIDEYTKEEYTYYQPSTQQLERSGDDAKNKNDA